MSERTIKEVQKAQKDNETAVKNTYTAAVYPLYVGKSRMIPPRRSDELTWDELVEPTVHDFAADRLHQEGPCYFVKGLIKGPSNSKEPGLKSPRPDIGFSIREQDTCPNPPKFSASVRNLIRAAGCLDH